MMAKPLRCACGHSTLLKPELCAHCWRDICRGCYVDPGHCGATEAVDARAERGRELIEHHRRAL